MSELYNHTSNKQKYHFFIGNIFRDQYQKTILKNIQKKLKKKYNLKDYHVNHNLFGNLIYLGYFDNETVSKYMNNIISNLLTAISNKFDILKCKYTSYKVIFDKSYYKISLNFTDSNNFLDKIIVPYLYENGIKPIYERKRNLFKPSIDLIYYKKSYILEQKKGEILIQVPPQEFTIDHLSLIKGTPIKSRIGTASTHDQMYLEEVQQYTFPLNPEKNNLNNTRYSNGAYNGEEDITFDD